MLMTNAFLLLRASLIAVFLGLIMFILYFCLGILRLRQ